MLTLSGLLLVAVLIGITIGLVLGLTGAGGSAVALPLLLLGLHLMPDVAAGFSLGAVALAAGIGVLLRAGKKQIIWSAAALLGISGALLAPLGQYLAQQLPTTWILATFTLLTLAIAGRMWQQANQNPETTRVLRAGNLPADNATPLCALSDTGYFEWRWPCVLRMAAVGAVAGVLSGLFGVGGGFVIVPALVLFAGLPMVQAVATSLAIIVVVAGVGFGSFALQRPDELLHLWPVAAGSVAGMGLGTWLAPKFAGPQLQKLFALMIVALSASALLQHVFA